jgi:hypothetical protein
VWPVADPDIDFSSDYGVFSRLSFGGGKAAADRYPYPLFGTFIVKKAQIRVTNQSS